MVIIGADRTARERVRREESQGPVLRNFNIAGWSKEKLIKEPEKVVVSQAPCKGRGHYYLHFKDEKTKTCGGQVSTRLMEDLGLEHRSPDPCRSVGKQSACNARDLGSIPGSERSGEGNGNPLQYSCLENPMDRGAWQATVHGVVRVRHNLVIKPSLQALWSFKWNKGSFSSAQAPRESRELVLLQRCLEMLMLVVEHFTLSDTGSENQGWRGRETPFSVSLRI